MPPRWKLLSIAPAVLLALSACGGKKAAAPAPLTESATLGPAGGALGVTGADGTRFDLVVPAGALSANTALTLTAEPPESGHRFHVVLGPPGVAFKLGAPATLTVRLPGAALPATGGVAVDGAGVPFTRGAGGALSVPLRSTSTLAAQARVGASASLSLTPASCGTPTISSTGVTGADTVDLALYAACMQAAVDQLDATGRYEEAVKASLSVAALLQRLGGNGAGDAQTFIDAATATACRARGAAFSLAAGAGITDLGEVFTFMRPMAYWEAVTQGLGASCGGQASFSDAAADLTTKALTLYDGNRPQVQDPAGARYHGTVVEAQDAQQVRAEVASLQPPAPVTSVVDAQVKDRAERTLVDTLLDGPWTACHASGDYQPLMAVMEALVSPDAAKDVAQYCAVSVTVEALSAATPIASSLGRAGPLGDSAHGTRSTRGSVKAALDGSLRLTGTARALACPVGMDSPEALVLALNGHEVRRLTDPSYLGNPLNLDLTQLLTTAGLDPVHPPASLLLTLTRDGDACGGYWGAHPSPLLSVDLSAVKKIAFVCGSGICTINPDGTGQATVAVDGSGPVWSHDHARIAFISNNVISIVQADGSGRINLPSSGTGTGGPAWSPGGTQLAFTQYGNAVSICVVNVDGSGLRCLPESILTVNGNGWTLSAHQPEPAWSPDGTRFAFTGVTFTGGGPPASYAYNKDIFLVSLDGGGAVNLTNNTLARQHSYHAAWSPDGTRIAYMQEDANSFTVDVFVMTVGGGGGAKLTTSGTAYHPTWSPDGTRIAYEDVDGIRVMNADGTGQTVLGPDHHPTWSPDGTQIALADYASTGIWVMNADGTGRTRLADGDYPAW